MRVLIVSGISGSGKTTFLRALEDLGFFCVDNFPLVLLKSFLELCQKTERRIERCAVVIDIREREFPFGDEGSLRELKEQFGIEVVFLESSNETLIKRFRETRRAHPLWQAHTIEQAIEKERAMMEWLKEMADRVIDTTYLTPHELRKFVFESYGREGRRMKVNLISFGYAKGIPHEADLIFDVRFLPNPFFVEGMREKTGLDEEVGRFIEAKEEYKRFHDLLMEFLLFLLPLYEKEGKSYLSIGFGCSGGRHRSPFVVRRIGEELRRKGYDVASLYRELER
jgi:UPF0042 nucleotide-binding protein